MWFEDLFGLTEHSPAQVQEHLLLKGTRLTSLANNKSHECGTLQIHALERLRTGTTAIANGSTEHTTLTPLVGKVQNLHAAAENRPEMFQIAFTLEFKILHKQCPLKILFDAHHIRGNPSSTFLSRQFTQRHSVVPGRGAN